MGDPFLAMLHFREGQGCCVIAVVGMNALWQPQMGPAPGHPGYLHLRALVSARKKFHELNKFGDTEIAYRESQWGGS